MAQNQRLLAKVQYLEKDRRRIENLDYICDDLQDSNYKLQAKLEEMTDTADIAKSRLKDAQWGEECLTRINEELEYETRIARGAQAELKRETEKWKKIASGAEDDFVRKYVDLIEEIERLKKAKVTLARNAKTEKTTLRRNAANSLKNVTAERNKLRGDLAKMTKERKDVHGTLNTVTTEREGLRDELDSMTEERDGLLEVVNGLEEDEEERSKEMAELKKYKRDRESLDRLFEGEEL